VQSLFMPVFLGTTLAAAVLAGLAIFRWSEPGSIAMLAGGLLYVVGMFGVIAIFNVPLNNALAAIDPSSAEGASFWLRFVQDWTIWNHVRTAASVAACTLFTVAIAAR
jgi:uncharacterized membrane protein